MNSKEKFLILTSDSSNCQPNGQCDCEGGDCACELSSLSQLNLDRSLAHPDADFLEMELVQSPFSRITSLDDNFSAFFGLSHPLAVLNQRSLLLLSEFIKPIKVKEVLNKFDSSVPRDVLYTAIQNLYQLSLIVSPFSSLQLRDKQETLTAWLHITDRCNLRCDYCYLPHVAQDMSLETGRAAIAATFRSAIANHYRRVKLKYAGGEALLCPSLIQELHQYAQTLGREHDLIVDGVILSNGTLINSEIIAMIKRLNLRLMISLDGLETSHNSQRKFANNQGSFKKVEAGINLALASKLIPDISVTVSGRNSSDLPDLVEWLLQRDLPFSLNFYRENILSLSHQDLCLQEAEIIEYLLKAYKVIEANLPNRSLLGSLVDRSNLSAIHQRTCSVGQSYLVFDYKGQVAKCQMQMHKTVSSINAEDPLQAVRQDTQGINNLSVEDKEGCRTCEWKYWCTGGCSLATFQATGRYDIQSPNCNIYKALYPEVIRLEGLRILRGRLKR